MGTNKTKAIPKPYNTKLKKKILFTPDVPGTQTKANSKNQTHLLVKIIDIERDIGKLNGAGAELHVELVEIDVPQYELPQFLLQQEFADALDCPLGEHLLRRFGEVPRKHPEFSLILIPRVLLRQNN